MKVLKQKAVEYFEVPAEIKKLEESSPKHDKKSDRLTETDIYKVELIKKIEPQLVGKIIQSSYTQMCEIYEKKQEIKNQKEVKEAKTFIKKMGNKKGLTKLLKT